MKEIYAWIIHTFFIKDINIVLGSMNKTLADLDIVAAQQLDAAEDADRAIMSATVARDEADARKAQAIRVAAKLAELLK